MKRELVRSEKPFQRMKVEKFPKEQKTVRLKMRITPKIQI